MKTTGIVKHGAGGTLLHQRAEKGREWGRGEGCGHQTMGMEPPDDTEHRRRTN